MLRNGGVAKAEEFGEFADRTFAVDQLADDQQADGGWRAPSTRSLA